MSLFDDLVSPLGAAERRFRADFPEDCILFSSAANITTIAPQEADEATGKVCFFLTDKRLFLGAPAVGRSGLVLLAIFALSVAFGWWLVAVIFLMSILRMGPLALDLPLDELRELRIRPGGNLPFLEQTIVAVHGDIRYLIGLGAELPVSMRERLESTAADLGIASPLPDAPDARQTPEG